ncbi:unnamed protein product [Camellia sinensis]
MDTTRMCDGSGCYWVRVEWWVRGEGMARQVGEGRWGRLSWGEGLTEDGCGSEKGLQGWWVSKVSIVTELGEMKGDGRIKGSK